MKTLYIATYRGMRLGTYDTRKQADIAVATAARELHDERPWTDHKRNTKPTKVEQALEDYK